VGTVGGGTAIAANAHGAGPAGEHAFHGKFRPFTDAVAVFIEKFIPAVIEGEEQFCGTRDIHGVNYSPGILPVKRKSACCPQSQSSLSAQLSVCLSHGAKDIVIIPSSVQLMNASAGSRSMRASPSGSWASAGVSNPRIILTTGG